MIKFVRGWKAISICLTIFVFPAVGFSQEQLGASLADKQQEAATRQQEVKLKLKDADDKPFTIQFLRYEPKKRKADKKLPLVLFLHGAGERGDNLRHVKLWGPPAQIAEGKDFPAVVISPQCPKGSWWNSKHLKAMLDHQIKERNIDPDRVYVTGLSMGGFGTWNLLAAYPKFFAAGIPICGGGVTSKAKSIIHIPVWVFHGDADKVVPILGSQRMVEALKEAGGKPKFTIYKGVGHNSWSKAYKDPETYKWLFKQVRKKK